MNRRHCFRFVAASAAAAWSTRVLAHHGWSSFDQERPLYLQGRVVEVRWRNPHAELVIDVPAGLSLPSGLAERRIPAQSAPIDAGSVLAKASLPRRRDQRWELELAPLFRLSQWQLDPVAEGTQVEVVGFGFRDERGPALLRVEFLFVDGRAYALRSSPA